MRIVNLMVAMFLTVRSQMEIVGTLCCWFISWFILYCGI